MCQWIASDNYWQASQESAACKEQATASLGAVVTVVLLIAVGACIAEIRHHEEWARLPIDTGKGTLA